MRIGIISDTHGSLPGLVFEIFSGMDLIFHAGDIGDESIITQLEAICPVYAVYGNIDAWPVSKKYPRTVHTSVDGLSIFMIHDIVDEKYIRYELFRNNLQADIVISGHTHRTRFSESGKMLFLNPGSVSKPKPGEKGTVVRLDLSNKPPQPEFIELDI